MATKDLPFLQKALPVPFEFAVLKGRSNYLCVQRVKEVAGGDEQMQLDDVETHGLARQGNPQARRVGPQDPRPATAPTCRSNRSRGRGRW